jgi:hypothetical protein
MDARIDDTAPVPGPIPTLTEADEIRFAQQAEEMDLARLEHAVAILNHHLPAFGFLQAESFGQPVADAMPEEIKAPLVAALVAAARYARRMFEEGAEEGAEDAD